MVNHSTLWTRRYGQIPPRRAVHSCTFCVSRAHDPSHDERRIGDPRDQRSVYRRRNLRRVLEEPSRESQPQPSRRCRRDQDSGATSGRTGTRRCAFVAWLDSIDGRWYAPTRPPSASIPRSTVCEFADAFNEVPGQVEPDPIPELPALRGLLSVRPRASVCVGLAVCAAIATLTWATTSSDAADAMETNRIASVSTVGDVTMQMPLPQPRHPDLRRQSRPLRISRRQMLKARCESFRSRLARS